MGAQQHWSLAAGANQTADPNINQREGIAPSQVNDAARQIIARVKPYLLDTSGLLTTGGILTAYTVTTNEGFNALVDGTTLVVRLHVTNGAAATFSPDGQTPRPLRVAPGVAIPANALIANVPVRVTYYAANDEWLAQGAQAGMLAA